MKIVTFIICLFSVEAWAVDDSIFLDGCDDQMNTEIQRFDKEVASIKLDWRKAVIKKLEASGLSEDKQTYVGKSFTIEMMVNYKLLSKGFNVVTAVRVPTILPVYDNQICKKPADVKSNNDTLLTGYRNLVFKDLNRLDSMIEEAKK